MALFRNTRTLLTLSEASAEAAVSAKQRVIPTDGDTVADHQQLWRVFFDATQEGGADAQTTDVMLETSHDGESWIKVASSTQLTADGSTHDLKEITALGPWVRARTELGGGTPPSHTAKVVLASTSPFRLASK
jgi:hypothetical protein